MVYRYLDKHRKLLVGLGMIARAAAPPVVVVRRRREASFGLSAIASFMEGQYNERLFADVVFTGMCICMLYVDYHGMFSVKFVFFAPLTLFDH